MKKRKRKGVLSRRKATETRGGRRGRREEMKVKRKREKSE